MHCGWVLASLMSLGHKTIITWALCSQKHKWCKVSFKKTEEFSCREIFFLLFFPWLWTKAGVVCSWYAFHPLHFPGSFWGHGFISPRMLSERKKDHSSVLIIVLDKQCQGNSFMCGGLFQWELNIIVSRRPFTFCVWFGHWRWSYSYKDLVYTEFVTTSDKPATSQHFESIGVWDENFDLFTPDLP